VSERRCATCGWFAAGHDGRVISGATACNSYVPKDRRVGERRKAHFGIPSQPRDWDEFYGGRRLRFGTDRRGREASVGTTGNPKPRAEDLASSPVSAGAAPSETWLARVETGPVRIGDDWVGIFIRGDAAQRYGLAVGAVAYKWAPAGEWDMGDRLDQGTITELAALLGSCCEPCEAVALTRLKAERGE